MDTKATLTDVTDGLTTLEGDVSNLTPLVAKLGTDSGVILDELKALQGQTSPDLSGIVARQAALHTSLQGLSASLTTLDGSEVAGGTTAPAAGAGSVTGNPAA